MAGEDAADSKKEEDKDPRIRNIRKKLAQIASLEQKALETELNEEQQDKLSRKEEFEAELQQLLNPAPPEPAEVTETVEPVEQAAEEAQPEEAPVESTEAVEEEAAGNVVTAQPESPPKKQEPSTQSKKKQKPKAESASQEDAPAKSKPDVSPEQQQIDSKVRALKKKLAQIVVIEEKRDEGIELSPEQVEKLERKEELEAELAELLEPKPKASKKAENDSPKATDTKTVYVVTAEQMDVFESPHSDQSLRILHKGDFVEPAGEAVDVDGYMMLPVKPQGAVEMSFLEAKEVSSTWSPTSLPIGRRRSWSGSQDLPAVSENRRHSFGAWSPAFGVRTPSMSFCRSPSMRWQDDPVSVEDIAPEPKAMKEAPKEEFEFIENIQPFGASTRASERLQEMMREVSLLSKDAFEEDALAMVSRKSGWRMTLMARPEGYEAKSSPSKLEGFSLEESADDFGLDDEMAPALIGFIIYRLRPEYNCLSIAKLAIVPEHRGQGHGRRVIEWCLKSAKKQSNVNYLSLSSLPEAVKFYQRIGFRAENVKIDAGLEEGESLVEGQVYMEYRIKGRGGGKKKGR